MRDDTQTQSEDRRTTKSNSKRTRLDVHVPDVLLWSSTLDSSVQSTSAGEMAIRTALYSHAERFATSKHTCNIVIAFIVQFMHYQGPKRYGK